MTSIPKDYIERLHAGWYGKLIGVRYGAPIENWSYEGIQKLYGELDGYLVDYKDFAADDDSNGPIFFLRALEDYGLDATAEQMGLTWLNYVSEGKGFFWWGGYGVSTEETAYYNLKNGIPAPRSGSIAQNGAAVAEQIGGQIFIDSWGLIAPGNPVLAAEYARRAASVSHDGNGIYGAIFVAAAVSHAFVERDIHKVIDKALSLLPADCEYMRMATDILGFYRAHPDNWRDAFAHVKECFGYDRYPGNCHIIPNSAVMLLSMLYGNGEFDKTLNICNMCGWDTDCNVGNVGCIMGVLVGLEGISYPKWIQPINDFFCCSCAIGSLNILDVPWCVQYIADIAYRIAKEAPPPRWHDFVAGKTPKFCFDLPKSTHGFRVRFDRENRQEYSLRQTTDKAYEGQGCLLFATNKIWAGDDIYLYHKTFYHRADLHDSRYDPSFSPILYPGETISCQVTVPESMSGRVRCCLFVKDDNSGDILHSEPVLLSSDGWSALRFTIPAGRGMLIGEAGVVITPCAVDSFSDRAELYLDSFDFSGGVDYGIDMTKEKPDKWHAMRTEIGQFTTNKGIWTIEGEYLSGSCSDHAECLTGRYDLDNYTFTATMNPQLGGHHQLQFRVGGLIRCYALALLSDNRLALLKNENGYKELASIDYEWKYGQDHSFTIKLQGPCIKVCQGSHTLFDLTDTDSPYLRGQIGMGVRDGSHCHFSSLYIKSDSPTI